MTRRCVILARVSTKEKGQDPETQVAMVRAAIQRQGWVESHPPVVLKFSGWSEDESKEVVRLALEVIERGDADTLCVWKVDRVLRRGIRPTLDFFDRLEKHLGGSFYSLTEPMLSTATLPDGFREFVASLFAFLARQESDVKSERVLAKREVKRNRAAALGQRATWGRGAMATPTEEDEVVRLAGAGQSVRVISAATGVSKSQVSRIVERRREDVEAIARGVPGVPAGQFVGSPARTGPSEGGGLGQSAAAPVAVRAGVPGVPGVEVSDMAPATAGSSAAGPLRSGSKSQSLEVAEAVRGSGSQSQDGAA